MLSQLQSAYSKTTSDSVRTVSYPELTTPGVCPLSALSLHFHHFLLLHLPFRLHLLFWNSILSWYSRQKDVAHFKNCEWLVVTAIIGRNDALLVNGDVLRGVNIFLSKNKTFDVDKLGWICWQLFFLSELLTILFFVGESSFLLYHLSQVNSSQILLETNVLLYCWPHLAVLLWRNYVVCQTYSFHEDFLVWGKLSLLLYVFCCRHQVALGNTSTLSWRRILHCMETTTGGQ